MILRLPFVLNAPLKFMNDNGRLTRERQLVKSAQATARNREKPDMLRIDRQTDDRRDDQNIRLLHLQYVSIIAAYFDSTKSDVRYKL